MKKIIKKKHINNNTACGWNIKKKCKWKFLQNITNSLNINKMNVTKSLTYLSHDCCLNKQNL